MNESCPTYEWVMSHIWMSHIPHMNESCPTHEWVMSHIWMSHVPHMNESCPTHEWVMSYTYEWVTSHRMNVSLHTHQCVISYMNVSRSRHALMSTPVCSCHITRTLKHECVKSQRPHIHAQIWLYHINMSHQTHQCVTSSENTPHYAHICAWCGAFSFDVTHS